MSKKNPWLDYQVISYLAPDTYKMVVASAASQGLTKSRMLIIMIESYIEKNYSEHQRKSLMNFFDELTPKEKTHPQTHWRDKQ